MNTQRAIVYIDGLNLYYGIRDDILEVFKAGGAEANWLKWLDIQSLAESIMEEHMELARVKYFTTKIKYNEVLDNRENCRRQAIYLNALEAHSTKLDVTYGTFLLRKYKCPECSARIKVPEEKRTDVNIASHMLKDAFDKGKNFDAVYLVSGDSDLATPVEIVSQMKRVIIVSPPKRKSDCLIDITGNRPVSINRRMLSKHPLPLSVSKDERVYECPQEWRQIR